MTIVYSNTDKPYAQWVPSYKIIVVWDGLMPKLNWLPYDTYKIGKPIAEALAKAYPVEQKFNLARINVARYREDILNAVAVILRSMGFSAEPQFNRFEINHCHTMIIRKR